MSPEEIATLEHALAELKRTTKRPVHKQVGKHKRKHERKKRRRKLPPTGPALPPDVKVEEFDIPLMRPEGWVTRRRGRSIKHTLAELERQRSALREVEARRAGLLRGSSPF